MQNFNYNKLQGKVKEVFGTQEKYARAIGRSSAYVSQLFNGKSFFSQTDIQHSAEVLGIPRNAIGDYFFTQKVHKNETDTTLK